MLQDIDDEEASSGESTGTSDPSGWTESQDDSDGEVDQHEKLADKAALQQDNAEDADADAAAEEKKEEEEEEQEEEEEEEEDKQEDGDEAESDEKGEGDNNGDLEGEGDEKGYALQPGCLPAGALAGEAALCAP